VETAARIRPLDEESSTDRWIERPTAPDDVQLADLIAGDSPPKAWEQIDPAQRNVGLNRLLGQLSRQQRQALLLSAADGLDADEIAAIQRVGPEDAAQRVSSARDRLTHLLNQEETWPQLQEQIERHADVHRRGTR